MLKQVINNVKRIGKNDYVADIYDDIFVMDSRYGDYSYNIYKIAIKNGQTVKTLIEYPTQEQREYALLNAIINDNNTNLNKKGIYQKSVDQLCAYYQSALYEMIKENWSTARIFEEFGLAPDGEYLQGAYNGLIKDVLAGRQIKQDKSKLDYVFRGERPVELENYLKAIDGSVYYIKPKFHNYGYKLYQMKDNTELEVQNPNLEQLEYALFNTVLKDNWQNPNKTGIYQNAKEYVLAELEDALIKMQKGHFGKDDFMKRFGLEFSGELMSSAVEDLIVDTQNGIKAEEEIL